MNAEVIREATLEDAAAIQRIAVDAEMFSEEDAGFLAEQLAGCVSGELEGSRWLMLERDGRPVASAFYAPEPFSDRMWNLYFIAVSPSEQGTGCGRRLMAHVEQSLRDQGPDVARNLIVETSSTDKYESTRGFYRHIGYDEEATIRQFYGPEDHKIVFWKSLVG